MQRMSTPDIAGPVAYYAAGILMWAEVHRRKNFLLENISIWSEDGVYDYYSSTYFADKDLVNDALDYLIRLSALSILTDNFGPAAYFVNSEVSLKRLAEEYEGSPFWKAEVLGSTWVRKALAAVSTRQESEHPSSLLKVVDTEFDVWQPLKIDCDNQAAKETFDEIEKVIKGISSDNGFAVTFPIERDSLVSHAEATLDSAKAGQVTRNQIKHNLVAAGRWLSEKFGGTAIGTLGSELMKWGLRLLGLMS
jgi:hypothetical protein